jgi:hypothetical protein
MVTGTYWTQEWIYERKRRKLQSLLPEDSFPSVEWSRKENED